MSFRFLKRRALSDMIAIIATLSAITSCAIAPAPNAPALNATAADTPAPFVTVVLGEGRFTPLGRVRVSENPTASDYTTLTTAENGKLGQPVFVEFYADN